MNYTAEDRKRLGVRVKEARTRAGYNRSTFAEALKRSKRQVQALENGETGVGQDTLVAAAQVLGWSLDRVYAILSDEESLADAAPRREDDQEALLDGVSNAALLAQLGRRLERGRENLRAALPGEVKDPVVLTPAQIAEVDRLVQEKLAEEANRFGLAARRSATGPGLVPLHEAQDQAESGSQDPGDMESR